MPKLTLSLADGTEQSHELTEEVITIGRLADNTMQIDDASVSSHHAKLTVSGNEYELEDLNSTNGTRLNGQRVTEITLLKSGDRLRFGKIEAYYGEEVPDEIRPLPEHEGVSVTPAESSSRPADFANASPFKTKRRKKEPLSAGIMAFSIFSIVVFAGAVAMILMLQPPQ